jgi:hypothetical protein
MCFVFLQRLARLFLEEWQGWSISDNLLLDFFPKCSVVVRRPLDCGTARKWNRSLCPTCDAEKL